MKAWEEEYAKRIYSGMDGWGAYPYHGGIYGSVNNLRTYHDLIH
jgi:hypothetical protein